MASLSVTQLFERYGDRLKLRWLAGQTGGNRLVLLSAEEPPPLACATIGYLNLIRSHQIQVIGGEEAEYLDGLEISLYREALQRVFTRQQPACIIFTEDRNARPACLEQANSSCTPLFCSSLSAQQMMNDLHAVFLKLLAQRIALHGVLMDVLGTGVLIMGDSGIGKSELALELVSRGHRLVADDMPEFTKLSPDTLNGTAIPGMAPFLEVRGLGVLNVQNLFGTNAVKSVKNLHLIVQLIPSSSEGLLNLDRLHGSYSTRIILGVNIPETRLLVAPGRNLAVLLECAVRNHTQKRQGYNAAEDFIQRQRELSAGGDEVA